MMGGPVFAPTGVCAPAEREQPHEATRIEGELVERPAGERGAAEAAGPDRLKSRLRALRVRQPSGRRCERA
jgi:hypothetical protein